MDLISKRTNKSIMKKFIKNSIESKRKTFTLVIVFVLITIFFLLIIPNKCKAQASYSSDIEIGSFFNLVNTIIQPGPEGKCMGITLCKEKDCSSIHYNAPLNAPLMVISLKSEFKCDSTVKKVFLQFPLTDIPGNVTIIFARLEFYGVGNSDSEDYTVSLSKLNNPWNEIDISWINQPQKEFVESKTFVSSSKHSWHSFNITNIVQDWAVGMDNFGFMISIEKGMGSAAFYSKDYYNAEYRPRIIVYYILI